MTVLRSGLFALVVAAAALAGFAAVSIDGSAQAQTRCSNDNSSSCR